jgi:hypothetical protein
MSTHRLTRKITALAFAGALSLALGGCSGDGDGGAPTALATYSLGGSVAGLTTAGLVLANGNDTTGVTPGATSFSFATALASGASYAVTVQTQPAGASCVVSGGSGTVASAAVAGVSVTCHAIAYTVGGPIAGLTTGGLVLSNGGDSVSPASGASIFTLPSPVASGAGYAVTVSAQPAGAVCSVAHASGTVGSAPVTNVAVTCAPNAFPIGGVVAGLTNAGLMLGNGSDVITLPSGALSFAFPSLVASGGSYAVSVVSQPAGLNCSVASGTGTVGTAAVNGVQVTCGPLAFTVGGTISGLTGVGLVLANGSDTVSPAAGATSFVLPNTVAFGGTYSVTVLTQPAGQTCSAAGTFPATIGSGNVTNVAVSCTTSSTYTLVAGQQTCPAQTIVDGTGAAASLNPQPTGAAVDSAGNYYTFDGGSLRKVTPGGVVTTLAGGAPGAGNGTQQDGTGSAAVFGGLNGNSGLAGVAVDGSGNVFVTDWHTIRKVTPAGVVTTIAGSTAAGFADGAGTAARFKFPRGMAFDGAGNLVVVDSGNFAIRRISPAGTVSTLAQGGAGFVAGAATNGTAQGVLATNGIAVDAAGNILVATTSPVGVQAISPAGALSDFAGSAQGFADGPGVAAKFYTTEDLSLDASGNLYVVDSFYAIRKVTPAALVSTPVVANAFTTSAPGSPPVPAGALVLAPGIGLYRALATPSGHFYLIVGCSLQKTGP